MAQQLPKTDLFYASASNPYSNYQNYFNPYQYANGYASGAKYGYTPIQSPGSVPASIERDLSTGVKKFGVAGGWDTGSYGWEMSEKKKQKKSAALSALTLLAFLFFLNLLQSCLKEQMYAMNPTLMVMTASASKLDPLGPEVQRSSENSVKYQPEDNVLSTLPTFDNPPIKRKKFKRTRGKKRPLLKKEGRINEVVEPRNSTKEIIAPKLMNSDMVA